MSERISTSSPRLGSISDDDPILAFDGAAASLFALAEARSHMVQTHQTLAALARRLGLEILAVGQLDKPGDQPPVGGGDDSPVIVARVNKAFENRPNKNLPTTPPMC